MSLYVIGYDIGYVIDSVIGMSLDLIRMFVMVSVEYVIGYVIRMS